MVAAFTGRLIVQIGWFGLRVVLSMDPSNELGELSQWLCHGQAP